MPTNSTLRQFKNLWSPQHRGEKILLSTLAILKKAKLNPLKLLLTSIKRLRPGVKLITQVKAGKVFYLPAYQTEHSANYYAIKWLYKGAIDRKPKAFSIHELVQEIYDTLKKDSRAFKSKLDLIKLIRESKVNLRKKWKKIKFKKNFYRKKKSKKLIPKKYKRRIFTILRIRDGIKNKRK